MSEIAAATNFSKIVTNIPAIKPYKRQLKSESQFKQQDKFVYYLNEASKYNLDRDTNSSAEFSKDLLSDENIESEDSANRTVKKNNHENSLQRMNDNEQLVASIFQQLKNTIDNYPNLEDSTVSDNKELLLIDKLISKLSLENTLKNASENVSNVDNMNLDGTGVASTVDNKNTDRTSIISNKDQLINGIKQELEKLLLLKDGKSNVPLEKKDSSKLENIKLVLDKIGTKSENNVVQRASNGENKLSGDMVDKQSAEEISVNKELLSELQGIESSKNISSHSSVLTNSTVSNNNGFGLIDKLISKLNLDNVLTADNKNTDKTSVIVAKDQLINDIKQELQKLLSMQDVNSNVILGKQGSIKQKDIKLILDKINNFLVDKIGTNKESIKTETNVVKQKSNEWNNSSSNMLMEQSSKQYSEDINVIKKMLSELKLIKGSKDIISNPSVLKKSTNSTVSNNNNLDLIDKLISKFNLGNILENASENVSIGDNKNTDGTSVVSPKEQLINGIKQELKKLLSLKDGNSNTTLENQISMKQNDIKAVLDKINNLLEGQVDTKANPRSVDQNTLMNDKLSVSLSEYYTESFGAAKADKSSAKSETNVVQALQNVLSKLEDIYKNTDSTSNKVISSNDNTIKNKDNEFLNNLVDNKDSGDKYSKVINVMNQFTLNTADTINKNQDIQPQVINRDNFASDFIKSLNYMEDNNVKNMTVKIVPKELGEMFIKISSDGNVMKATIIATNKDSYNLLNSNLHEINNFLNNLHIRIHSLDINIYNGDTTYFSGNNSFNSNQFNEHNSNNNRSNNEIINLDNNNMEEIDGKYENSTKGDNNVNALV